MGAMSYLTLNGREVANSARTAAFRDAGLMPQTYQIQGNACGVLQREAGPTGRPCSYLGFMDLLSEPASPSPSTSPAYNTTAQLNPQDKTGVSDGYQEPQSTQSGFPVALPVQAGAWLDGIVVTAFEVVVGAANLNVTAAGRMNGTFQNGLLDNNHVSAFMLWDSATTAHLVLRFWAGDSSSITDVLTGPTLTVPRGRQWLVLRLAGDAISAEWWTADPRMGGKAFSSITYTLTGAIFQGIASDRQLFGVPGYQSAVAGQTTPGKIALPEWWSTPVCDGTAHLYPSPFLYPSPTLYPDETDGSQSVLATTPWTDSSRPESKEFLGLWIDEIDGLDGSITRSVDQKMGGLGGASLGPLVATGRAVKVHGYLMAQSCRGLDYGREWLIDILSTACNPCPDAVMRIRVAVPSPDDGTNDAEGLYYFYDVGLTDGPVIGPSSADCDLAEVNFTLTAGNGLKYQAPLPLVAATTFASANGSIGQQIPAPPGIGTNGAIITIKAGSADLLNVFPAQQLSTYPSDLLYPSDCFYPNDGGLPVTLPITTCPTGFVIPIIPKGGTLIIDNARHRITYIDAAGVVQDGTFLLSQNTARSIDWLEAQACDAADADFVLVGAGTYAPDATVQIDVQHREG